MYRSLRAFSSACKMHVFPYSYGGVVMPDRPKAVNLTEMSLNRALMRMALPTIGWMIIESLFNIVDAFWVGKLGAQAFASASAASFVLWMLFAFSDIAAVSANALTAQSVGAGRFEDVPQHFWRCAQVTIPTGLFFGLVFYLFSPTLFSWLGLEKPVSDGAWEYLLPWLLGLPLVFFVAVIIAVFRGSGDARTPMLLMFMMVVLNALLDPVFIFGMGPFPALGLAGAAWVSVFCHLVLLVCALAVMKRRHLLPCSGGGFSMFVPDFDYFRRIVFTGLPVALNGAFFSLIYIGLTGVISSFGSVAVAAVGMGHRIESFPWFFCYGFSIAAASMVGQYIGAGRIQDAVGAVWRAAVIASVFVAVFIVAILFFAEEAVGIFINDPSVIAESGVYLRIVAVSWAVGMFEIVLSGAFSGSGHTLPPMLVGIPLTALRIPVAYILAVTLGWGAAGVWFAIGITSVAKGALMLVLFLKGGWKKSRLIKSFA